MKLSEQKWKLFTKAFRIHNVGQHVLSVLLPQGGLHFLAYGKSVAHVAFDHHVVQFAVTAIH
jgi:hypothetical protein